MGGQCSIQLNIKYFFLHWLTSCHLYLHNTLYVTIIITTHLFWGHFQRVCTSKQDTTNKTKQNIRHTQQAKQNNIRHTQQNKNKTTSDIHRKQNICKKNNRKDENESTAHPPTHPPLVTVLGIVYSLSTLLYCLGIILE